MTCHDAKEHLRLAHLALREIREHHVRLNLRAGRAIEESKTISICDRILKESK